ncbi:MAG: hypothetical protein IT355_20600 [Gemmatimonadaceae bacterium]|nr:hypothetical protein [Gemmatimonadaceae bacterium]
MRRALPVGEITPAGDEGVRQARLRTRQGTLLPHNKEGATGIYIITSYFED